MTKALKLEVALKDAQILQQQAVNQVKDGAIREMVKSAAAAEGKNSSMRDVLSFVHAKDQTNAWLLARINDNQTGQAMNASDNQMNQAMNASGNQTTMAANQAEQAKNASGNQTTMAANQAEQAKNASGNQMNQAMNASGNQMAQANTAPNTPARPNEQHVAYDRSCC